MAHFKTLKEHVYDYIAEQISNGTLKANSKISEQQVCEHLNVSRTPVREALGQLANEGYLINIPRKGFTVNELSRQKAEELYTIIGVLEGLAAVQAAPRLTDEQIADMKDLANRMEEAIKSEDYHEYYVLQSRFHDIFVEASGNAELERIINQIKKTFMRQSYYITKQRRDTVEILLAINNEHKNIAELLGLRDGEGAAEFLKNVHWNIKYADLEVIEEDPVRED